MELYNTLTRKIETFVPNEGNIVRLYTCGPTVYHYAHIGNLRSYLQEDILEKYLNYAGYKVIRAMNITDVGHLTGDSDDGTDKMVNSAKRENKTVLDIAKFYTEKFFEDCCCLNIKKPEIVVPATQEIDEYIKIISNLMDKGYAYQSGGNVYFDTSKLKEYYVLTNHNIEEMVDGAREDVTKDDNKKNRADFALWFTKSKFDNQELKWDSPWGTGYPGWHIECSGISIKYLGEYLDIHCGGVDNIFPHHTNEIAQSESYLGHHWCNYWFHVEHLNNKDGKMSKSKGDFITVSSLMEKGYNPLSYRYMILSSHYQKPLEFSYEILDSFENSYLKLKNKVLKLNHDKDDLNEEMFNKYKNEFMEAMNNNLNTSLALTTVYNVLKEDMNDYTKLALINDFDKVLSLDLDKEEEKEKITDQDILNLIEERNNAKKNKDFALADQIRDVLLSRGIKLIDTREGTKYEIVS